MAKAKKTKNRTNRKKKETKPTWTQSNIVRVCLFLCMIGISILALLRMGMMGNFLYQFVVLFLGTATPIFYILFIVWCAFCTFFPSKKIPKRYILALILLGCAYLLFVGIESYQGRPAWYGLQTTIGSAFDILIHGKASQVGVFGSILTGLIVTLFDYTGAFVCVILFVILAVALCGYEPMMAYFQSEKKKEKKAKEPKQEVIIHDTNKDSMFLEADPSPVQEIEECQQPEPKEEQEPSQPKHIIVEPSDADYTDYKCPRLSILEEVSRKGRSNINAQTAKQQGQKLMEILHEFGVNATLVQIHIGPSVTKFEVKPDLGVRVNKISNLQYDIKMALAAKDIRIEAPIPGKSAVGIEIPNVEKTQVQMKDLMRSIPADLQNKTLLFCLGKDLMGNNVYGQLDKMPHLLIAGATGSGKSVCVNAIICSLLLRTKPNEVKLILVDPKKVEFTPYNDVPHLLAPVITDGELANKGLKVVVQMMDHRYDLFGKVGVRNLESFNEYVLNHPDEHLKPLPRIVIIIDELADLMLVAAKEVEASIQRITQLARAAGIHLIVATQRPSVDVITGVIKANIPSRIAFAVSQAVDSRTILDQAGAERLLGYGDMLYLPNGETSARRIQGVFIKDEEVNRIATYVKNQAQPRYDDAFIQLKDLANMASEGAQECADPLYDQVKSFVISSRKASTSLIQRKFSIGYARAARLIDVLEDQKIIGPAHGSKPREILVARPSEDIEE